LYGKAIGRRSGTAGVPAGRAREGADGASPHGRHLPAAAGDSGAAAGDRIHTAVGLAVPGDHRRAHYLWRPGILLRPFPRE